MLDNIGHHIHDQHDNNPTTPKKKARTQIDFSPEDSADLTDKFPLTDELMREMTPTQHEDTQEAKQREAQNDRDNSRAKNDNHK